MSEVTRPGQQALLSMNIRWPVWARLLDSFYPCCGIGQFKGFPQYPGSLTDQCSYPPGAAPGDLCRKSQPALYSWWQWSVTRPLYYVMVCRARAVLWVDWVISSSTKAACSRNYYGPEFWLKKTSNQDDSWTFPETHTHSRISIQVDWLLNLGFQTYCPSKRGSMIKFKETEFLWQGYRNPLKQCWQVALVCLHKLPS